MGLQTLFDSVNTRREFLHHSAAASAVLMGLHSATAFSAADFRKGKRYSK